MHRLGATPPHTTRTTLEQDRPNHLALCCNALPTSIKCPESHRHVRPSAGLHRGRQPLPRERAAVPGQPLCTLTSCILLHTPYAFLCILMHPQLVHLSCITYASRMHLLCNFMHPPLMCLSCILCISYVSLTHLSHMHAPPGRRRVRAERADPSDGLHLPAGRAGRGRIHHCMERRRGPSALCFDPRRWPPAISPSAGTAAAAAVAAVVVEAAVVTAGGGSSSGSSCSGRRACISVRTRLNHGVSTSPSLGSLDFFLNALIGLAHRTRCCSPSCWTRDGRGPATTPTWVRAGPALCRTYGLSSNMMALITSNCGLSSNTMARITSGCVPLAIGQHDGPDHLELRFKSGTGWSMTAEHWPDLYKVSRSTEEMIKPCLVHHTLHLLGCALASSIHHASRSLGHRPAHRPTGCQHRPPSGCQHRPPSGTLARRATPMQCLDRRPTQRLTLGVPAPAGSAVHERAGA